MQFRKNIDRCRQIGSLHGALLATLTTIIDLDDLLRMELVLAVGSLDAYVHDVVRTLMVDVFSGRRAATTEYRTFERKMRGWLKRRGPRTLDEFDAAIRAKHDWLTFQRPNSIAKAAKLVYNGNLWQQISLNLAVSEADVCRHLNLIVDRRNKIAHEADLKPTGGSALWPIDASSVVGVVDFIDKVVVELDNVL